jgi:hypothetical protein
MKRLRGSAGALLFIASVAAAACPICFRGMAPTTAQQLALAERAMIVLPAMAGTEMRIVAVIKGSGAVNDLVQATAPGLEEAASRESAPLLVAQVNAKSPWSMIGSVGVEHADWLRRVVATTLRADATDAQWGARVAFLLPYLDHNEPLLAAIAYGELAAAPYGALRLLKGQLDPARCTRWLDDPGKQQLYTLLYGIAGGAHDIDVIERRIGAAWKRNDATNLAALLAADLELRGPSRVEWIEKMYFTDRRRTLAEIQAALLALSVHGAANAAVPRARVIQVYRSFIRERQPMAGFVAQDLAAWNHWGAGPEYLALLKGNALADPASRLAVVAYLMQSPRADAKAAVKSLKASRNY